MDKVFKVELDHMVEEQDGLGEARQLRRNLEEAHMKMGKMVRGNWISNLSHYLRFHKKTSTTGRFP